MKKRTVNGIDVLHKRYVGDDSARKAALEAERLNAQVARIIYDVRTEAGLSQKQLAKLVGTTQSVISRLEDADYHGHSLKMLNRIASVLDKTVVVTLSGVEVESNMRGDSRTPAEDLRELLKILRKLSDRFRVPVPTFATLIGILPLLGLVSGSVASSIARPGLLGKLSKEEKKLLDELIKLAKKIA